MDWNDDMIARIRDLWAEGHSTAEIGRRMGVTKNAIVGKAHRLALPARPSPIRNMADGAPRQRPPRPEIPQLTTFGTRTPSQLPMRPFLPATRLPSLQGLGHDRRVPVEATLPPLDGPDRQAPPRAGTTATPALERAVRVGTRTQPCCWPIGRPRTTEFRFCNAASLGGRPYCEEHTQVAYVRVRDRREHSSPPNA